VLRELKLGAPKAEVREVARRSERAVLDRRIVRCLEIAEERDSRSFSCVVLCFMCVVFACVYVCFMCVLCLFYACLCM